jgi:hypothetical protein
VQPPKLYEIYSPKNKKKNWPKRQMKNQLEWQFLSNTKQKGPWIWKQVLLLKDSILHP